MHCGVRAVAQPRTKAQQRQSARQVLSQLPLRQQGEVQELRHAAHYAIYGYAEGGYAIVAHSPLLPEVLGYTDSRYEGAKNPNLEWYLAQVDTVAAQAERSGQAVRRAPLPDTSRFPASVPALLTCTWGQEEPYWNLCPVDPRYGKCYTGCVATAMAQVLYYHKYPPHGYGQRTITYPLDSSNPKDVVTAYFGTTSYDWEHMRDSYTGSYTEQEADAVATLMMHCGVAANMNYSVSGSGTYTGDAAFGLREYFGISTARAYYRSDYVSSDWMDMIYTELSEHRPIVYGATDRQQGFGHAFVFDGYDEQGYVHVNWGWTGDANGYYNIDVLNPQTYNFNDDHDMVTGIYGKPMDLQTATFNVTQAGELAAAIDDEAAITYADLTVNGPINASDMRRLRFMAGRDEQGRTTSGHLRRLDLSGARFVSGGGTYLTEGDQQYQTANDELPARAFYGCQSLESITLPSTLRYWGQAALAMCLKLEEVNVTVPEGANFAIVDNVVTDRDAKKVLAVLPSARGKVKLPIGVTSVDAYAAAGCTRITSIHLPSTLTRLEQNAFYSCTGLTELRTYALTPPTVGEGALGGIYADKCQLAVRRNMMPAYQASMGWNIFSTNMREFYTIIKPRNATREYGDENPVFGYSIEGDDVDGDPLLTTEATPESPVDRYTITAQQGTIDDEAVEFGEGTLIVRKAPLVVRPADVARRPGEANPVFELAYEGLKNGETEPVYTVEPTITTTANEQSPEGEYPITVSGGEATNYSLSYQQGTLTVSADAPSAISSVAADNTGNPQPVYDLQGRRIALPGNAARGVLISRGKKIIQ